MPIIIVWILLLIFGLLAIFSVSIHDSFALGLRGIAQWRREGDPSNYFYFIRQIRNVAVGLVMSGIIYFIPIKFFQNNRNIIIIFVILILFQLLVFVPWIGVVFNWARWWISIPWLSTLQPSEFFKIGYVLFLASWLIRKYKMANTKEFFINFLVVNFVIFLAFLFIPDLGTVLVLWLAWLVMCRYAGAKFKYIALITIWGIFCAVSAALLASAISPKFTYITNRFTYFIRSDIDPQKRGIWWQNQQALIAIWWWWFWGQWYGKWLQKFGFIPEAQWDFIFSAFSEEIGFIGNIALLFLYFYLCRYFLSHLPLVRDEYSKLIGVGIISLIIMQMFVNIGVNLKILPNTWLTLPFISYGWSAIMVNMVQIILLYKILKQK